MILQVYICVDLKCPSFYFLRRLGLVLWVWVRFPRVFLRFRIPPVCSSCGSGSGSGAGSGAGAGAFEGPPEPESPLSAIETDTNTAVVTAIIPYVTNGT
jgi:hypothetical protein